MKVWIVLGEAEYEGYGKPEAVFSTREKADLFLSRFTNYGWDEIKILEYEVDVPPKTRP